MQHCFKNQLLEEEKYEIGVILIQEGVCEII
jgi:hypothetical protein